jgi:dihydropteroate synthase
VNQAITIVGALNVSPESFYKGSVLTTSDQLGRAARQMTQDGAHIIDVGAMSTAPYLKTQISEHEEAKRLSHAVAAIRRATTLPVSADTSRYLPAVAAVKAGATYINDVTGFHTTPRLATLAPQLKGFILMAHPLGLATTARISSPIGGVSAALRSSLKLAKKHRVPRSKIILDPGIGFFRDSGWRWWRWDLEVLRDLRRLRRWGRPVLAGVSRKSFIGELLDQKDPADRLAGSLAATTVALLNGATWIRTHDVKATRDVARIVSGISA